jgi:hypothetical protein
MMSSSDAVPAFVRRDDQPLVDRQRWRAGMRLLDPPHQPEPAHDLLGREHLGPGAEQPGEHPVPGMRAETAAPIPVGNRRLIQEPDEAIKVGPVAGRYRAEHGIRDHRQACFDRVEALFGDLHRSVLECQPRRDVLDYHQVPQLRGRATDELPHTGEPPIGALLHGR